MDALTVARSAGLELQRRGSRWFARSPFRNERTPSLCFFPDGRWYDFGGGQSGDAADLYAALYHVPLGEALRAVRGENWRPQPHKPDGHDLRRAVERWKGERWREACAKKHAARAIIKTLEITEPDGEQFWQAVADAAAAEDTLNLLEQATPRQFLDWMVEA
jgi:hypothetical protein